MKKLNLYKFRALVFFSGLSLLLASCSSDASNAQEIEISEFEVQKVLALDDYSAVADNAIAEAFMGREGTGKRFLTHKDNECYTTTYSDMGFTMVFNNCVLNDTDNVNGTLNVTYSTNDNSGSFTAAYTDFYVGSIKLNGTRTFTISATQNENEIAFTVESIMSITLADGEIITEEGIKTITLIFSQDSIAITFTGTWTLIENGDTYTITIIEDLSTVLGCEYISKGKFTLSKNGLEVTVDFGDGTCDNKAEIIYPNGKIEEITL